MKVGDSASSAEPPEYLLIALDFAKASLQDAFALASKAYHAENSFCGWQRFSELAAERPQFPHMYAGSLTKCCSSSDFESEGNSQILLLAFSSGRFRSDMGHLVWS